MSVGRVKQNRAGLPLAPPAAEASGFFLSVTVGLLFRFLAPNWLPEERRGFVLAAGEMLSKHRPCFMVPLKGMKSRVDSITTY